MFVTACTECHGRGEFECPDCICPDCEKGRLNCENCSGSGRTECRECGGTGSLKRKGLIFARSETCQACDGSGTRECPACSGSKTVPHDACQGTGRVSGCPSCGDTRKTPCGACDGGWIVTERGTEALGWPVDRLKAESEKMRTEMEACEARLLSVNLEYNRQAHEISERQKPHDPDRWPDWADTSVPGAWADHERQPVQARLAELKADAAFIDAALGRAHK